MMACAHNDSPEIVQMLVENGANYWAHDHSGSTPIFHAGWIYFHACRSRKLGTLSLHLGLALIIHADQQLFKTLVFLCTVHWKRPCIRTVASLLKGGALGQGKRSEASACRVKFKAGVQRQRWGSRERSHRKIKRYNGFLDVPRASQNVKF